MSDRMTENWKYLVKKYDEATQELGEAKRKLWDAEFIINRIKEHRAEFSLSSPIEWVQDLDRILGVVIEPWMFGQGLSEMVEVSEEDFTEYCRGLNNAWEGGEFDADFFNRFIVGQTALYPEEMAFLETLRFYLVPLTESEAGWSKRLRERIGLWENVNMSGKNLAKRNARNGGFYIGGCAGMSMSVKSVGRSRLRTQVKNQSLW